MSSDVFTSWRPYLHKLTEHGEPPVSERERHEGYRVGWRENNWAGEIFDFYLHTQ